jgi:hypothetical protein
VFLQADVEVLEMRNQCVIVVVSRGIGEKHLVEFSGYGLLEEWR